LEGLGSRNGRIEEIEDGKQGILPFICHCYSSSGITGVETCSESNLLNKHRWKVDSLNKVTLCFPAWLLLLLLLLVAAALPLVGWCVPHGEFRPAIVPCHFEGA